MHVKVVATSPLSALSRSWDRPVRLLPATHGRGLEDTVTLGPALGRQHRIRAAGGDPASPGRWFAEAFHPRQTRPRPGGPRPLPRHLSAPTVRPSLSPHGPARLPCPRPFKVPSPRLLPSLCSEHPKCVTVSSLVLVPFPPELPRGRFLCRTRVVLN